MPTRDGSTLIIIGGHEDKEGKKDILREVAAKVGAGKLVVTTVASHEPDGLFEQYERLFRGLGVKHVHKLAVDTREQAREEGTAKVLDDATGLFFTGGDQLRITSQIGDTPVFQKIQALTERGGVIAGTSAGASVLCETMLVSGDSEGSANVQDSIRMAPGLGVITDVIIDQHFAERGRMSRLLAAVAQNPAILGLGIDENTAVVVERDRFRVIGEGAVYVVDGSKVTASNIAEEDADKALSIYDVKLHVLSVGDRFDLKERRPGKVPKPKGGKDDQ
jgi:cyanophycinase